MIRSLITGLICSLLLAGCADGPSADRPSAGDMTVQAVPQAVGDVGPGEAGGGGEPPALGPGLKRLVDLAIDDLAVRQSVDRGTIEVVEADYVTWRDSGLGCPQPGHQALQVLTNGARILLGAAGKRYAYHSGPSRPPFLCKNPSREEPLRYGAGET